MKRITPTPRVVFHAILGEHRPVHHQMIGGFVVMVLGIGLIHTSAAFHDQYVLALFVDWAGASLHGLGLVPYIKAWVEE